MSDEELLLKVEAKFGRVEILAMREKSHPFEVFGEIGVHFGHDVMGQMYTAARLPVFVDGAVVTDAQQGYALPIGGIAALLKAISPNMVGVDIACMMMVTILKIAPGQFMEDRESLFEALDSVMSFGNEGFNTPLSHPIMDDPLWKELPHLFSRTELAIRQLGTSGGGNHFGNLMIGEVLREVEWLPLKPGDSFVALMTHSGSRRVGYDMARYYHSLATRYTQRVARGVPEDYSWLDINSRDGREYLSVMHLMGRYARANHALIHSRFLKESGLSPLEVGGAKVDVPGFPSFTTLEVVHNFAWVEGDCVIHRKGATPAHKGKPVIIPGSSGSPSYLGEGLGNPKSLSSCSHGAGRPFSRTEAKDNHDPKFVKEWMDEHDILHKGIAPDETVMAYKDIEEVIRVQAGTLMVPVAKMYPKVTLMGG